MVQRRDMELCPLAEFLDGQVGIGHAQEPIERVFIEPADVRANPEALERILEADMVVIGPGSLYSSVLPNLLISDIRDAVSAEFGALPLPSVVDYFERLAKSGAITLK